LMLVTSEPEEVRMVRRRSMVRFRRGGSLAGQKAFSNVIR
jgi:hypothetical protein